VTRARRVATTLLRLGVAAGLLVWLWRSGAVDLAGIAGTARSAAWNAEVFALLFLSTWAITLRWWLLLRLEEIDVSLLTALKLKLVAGFFNNFLPGSITGDVVKLYYVGGKSPAKKPEAYATVVIDRLIGLAALVFLVVIAALANRDFVFAPEHANLALTFYASAVVAAGFTGALLALVLARGGSGGLGGWLFRSRLPGIDALRRSYATLLRLVARPQVLLAALLLGMVSHALLVLVTVASARALGEGTLAISTYGFLVPLGFFVNAIPVGLPGGLGAGEAAMQELFWAAGAGRTVGVGVMVLNRIAGLPWSGIGAALYVFDRAALAPDHRERSARPLV
jgi:uncharacterized membrane protein YbhN (UPF0104 family)